MKPSNIILFQRYLYFNWNGLYNAFLFVRLLFCRNDKKENLKNEFKTFKPSTDCIIRITWLPNPVNHPLERSAYIGMEGFVRDVKPDGSFFLEGKTNSLVITREYTFEYISARDYFSEIREATEMDIVHDQVVYIKGAEKKRNELRIVKDEVYDDFSGREITFKMAEEYLKKGKLLVRDFEPDVPKKYIVKVKSCDNKFKWYFDKKEKTFEIEPNKVDGMYRTVDDVAGPGCKGFIEPKDIVRI